MGKTFEYFGITFHVIDGQKPCFAYNLKSRTYPGYINPDTDLDTLQVLMDAIEEDKRYRRRGYTPLPVVHMELSL